MEGTQSIDRATALLRAVSAFADGCTTAQAAASAGTTRPTATRILSALQLSGFLDFDNDRGMWLLGPELFLLGALAARRFDVADIGVLGGGTGEVRTVHGERPVDEGGPLRRHRGHP